MSSNNPAPIVKRIPNVIIIRVKRLSCSKNLFDNRVEIYNEAIRNNGYKNELKYLEANRHHKNGGNNIGNNRRNNNINIDNKISKNINKIKCWNITWFNPPFRKLSNINIGKCFPGLINKHFKDDNPIRKRINNNNVKISYSWQSQCKINK